MNSATIPEPLPYALYHAEQVRELDRAAIEDFGISGATLMQRAGEAAFESLQRAWPNASKLAVLCGLGNNGGDGYVVARLAAEAGMEVSVVQLGDPDLLTGDARLHADRCRASGVRPVPFERIPEPVDVIVDAILGTGLDREVTGAWRSAIQAVNGNSAPVLAVDIPSGLNADTGAVMGEAVLANLTVSFIGLKLGLFTGEGPAACGAVEFAGLGVPPAVYGRQVLSARRLDWNKQGTALSPRSPAAHKGHFGHVLVVGGNHGYGGAARLCAEAAARGGAGLASLATRPEHVSSVLAGRPEVMARGIENPAEVVPLLQSASVVALGPGLGRDAWAEGLWQQVLESDLPLVLDADGLGLLSEEPVVRDHWVLTPHPGEAARLLSVSVAEVQSDRFAAAEELQRRFGGVVVLKGAGTLIRGPGHRPVAVCNAGNPGMASGGMGDVLTGLIAALIAQGLEMEIAAETGVCLHATAADRAARSGQRGLLASDLFAELRPLLNGLTPESSREKL